MAIEEDTGLRRGTTATDAYVLRSYRSLRLAIVIVLVGLAGALVRQLTKEGCIEISISAYYYTPVHGLFIGSLVATGAAMVALKGRTVVEDSLFNVAGVLAPVVALVPTTRQAILCDGKSNPLVLSRNDLAPNSLVALLVAGFAVLVVTAFVAKLHDAPEIPVTPLLRSLRTVVAPSTALAVAAAVTVGLLDQPWYTFMHFGAAIGLFAAIFLAIGSLLSERFHNALHLLLTWARPNDRYRKPMPIYSRAYGGLLVATGPLAIVAAISGSASIFWIEVVGIASFTIFWVVQTAELWYYLPDPPPTSAAG